MKVQDVASRSDGLHLPLRLPRVATRPAPCCMLHLLFRHTWLVRELSMGCDRSPSTSSPWLLVMTCVAPFAVVPGGSACCPPSGRQQPDRRRQAAGSKPCPEEEAAVPAPLVQP